MTTDTIKVIPIDKICKNIGRLPLELRHAIFNCLTIDFRLEMIQSKSEQIIQTLYKAYDERILDIDALKELVNNGLRWHFFYRKEKNGCLITQPNIKNMLFNIEYKQMGNIVSVQHPIFKALRNIVIPPRIHGQIKSNSRNIHDSRRARQALTKIISTITTSCDILPTLTVPLDCYSKKKRAINGHANFNYYVRKRIFIFIGLLTKFISKFKEPLETAAIQDYKKIHMRWMKKTVIKVIPAEFRKMQRKIKLSAKNSAKEAKLAAKEAKLAAKKAKLAAKKAKLTVKKTL